ncbi:alpha/beta fold hydrolase [Brevibacterium ravenspurgense]|uniref:alpha/beta fold hydrolase n=1 Tax=Brevibacterium ravenspurgense TaxID=479117 RepID=UPI001EF33894|nr:alpha/beta fold hydrolase [Brevibacterium ravenspurgense]
MTHLKSLRTRRANSVFAAAAATALTLGIGVPAAASTSSEPASESTQESQNAEPGSTPAEEPAEETGTASDTEPGDHPSGESDDTSADGGNPSDTSADGAARAQSEAGDEAEEKPADEYYPGLAKKLFKKGEGHYQVPDPTAGGKPAGKVPSGLEAYYSQKIDWSAENCEALGLRDFSEELGRPAECGYMIAPIDAKNPEKGNIAIAVQRVKAGKLEEAEGGGVKFTPNSKPKGSVLYNPGGPGGSGMMFATWQAWDQPELAEDFDMIGFDPRGVGASMPFSECATDQQQDASRDLNPWKDGRDKAEEVFNTDTKKYADACFENTGKLFGLDAEGRKDLIKHLGTWDAVGDMDILRSVVGDEKLNYVGWSYGTSLGYRYAQKYGDSVGKLVLDGVVDPGDAEAVKALKAINARSDRFADLGDTVAQENSTGAGDKAGAGTGKTAKASEKIDLDGLTEDQKDTVNQGAGFQDTFEQFAKDCAAKGREGKTYGELWPDAFGETPLADQKFTCALGESDDPKVLSDNNAKLLQTLETADGGKGLPTGNPDDQRRITFSVGRLGEFQALYSTSLWPRLNFALNELKAGKSAGQLLILADMYDGRDESGHYDPSGAAFTNIRCTDSNSAHEPKDDAKLAQVRKFAEAYDAAAPFQRASVSPAGYDTCDFWKFKGTLPKSKQLTKVPNILVVSTSHDPATPYAAGVKMAQLIDGSLLSVAGNDHTSYQAAGGCVSDTVNTFLSEGRVPRDGDFGEKLDKPDTAKDHNGKTVNLPNKCKMQTFRTDGFTLSTSKAHVGSEVGFKVTHLDSETDYVLKIGDKTYAFTTDNGGNFAGVFSVPEGLKAGSTVEVAIVDAQGKKVGSAGLEILSKDKPRKDGPEAGGTTEGKDKPGDKGGDKPGDKPGDKGGKTPTDNAKGESKPLPRTGADVAGILAAAALLLAAGSAMAVNGRRKAHR